LVKFEGAFACPIKKGLVLQSNSVTFLTEGDLGRLL